MVLHVPGYTSRNVERSGHSRALVRQNILFHHFTSSSGNGCCNSENVNMYMLYPGNLLKGYVVHGDRYSIDLIRGCRNVQSYVIYRNLLVSGGQRWCKLFLNIVICILLLVCHWSLLDGERTRQHVLVGVSSCFKIKGSQVLKCEYKFIDLEVLVIYLKLCDILFSNYLNKKILLSYHNYITMLCKHFHKKIQSI